MRLTQLHDWHQITCRRTPCLLGKFFKRTQTPYFMRSDERSNSWYYVTEGRTDWHHPQTGRSSFTWWKALNEEVFGKEGVQILNGFTRSGVGLLRSQWRTFGFYGRRQLQSGERHMAYKRTAVNRVWSPLPGQDIPENTEYHVQHSKNPSKRQYCSHP